MEHLLKKAVKSDKALKKFAKYLTDLGGASKAIISTTRAVGELRISLD